MAAKFLRIGTRDTYDSLYCTDSTNGAGRNRLIQPWHLGTLRISKVAGFIIMLFDESFLHN